MSPINQRSVYVFLAFCLIFLIGVIAFIIFLNRPDSNTFPETNTPTPRGQTPNTDRINRNPNISPVEGEGSFSDEEVKVYLEERKRADAAYQDRLRRMPFITKLPKTTTHYKIEITAVSDTIYLTTYGPPSFREGYREEALSWIRQNGGNPASLTIQYKN